MEGPSPPPRLEEGRLSLDEPAEDERRAVADHGRPLRDDRAIRRGNPEPHHPVGPHIQRGAERHAEHQGSSAAVDQTTHYPIRRASDAALPVGGINDRARRDDNRVKHEQQIQEPQVRQRKRAGRQRRQVRGRCGNAVRECPGQPPRPHHGDRREENHPADHQRHRNSLAAIDPEAARPSPLHHHSREESGDEEEQRHAEDVRCELGERSTMAQIPGIIPGRNENPA
jgi:hypothetical protein